MRDNEADIEQVITVLADAMKSIAFAIFPSDSCGGHDAAGTYVKSLAESVMGITAELKELSNEIFELRQSVDGVANSIDNHG